MPDVGDWSSLNGERAIAGSLWIPAYGAWVADITLANASAISAASALPQRLVVGNLSLIGAMVRESSYAGMKTIRLVGGQSSPGWRKKLSARAYTLLSGVPSPLVLSDLAIECGEILGPVIPKFLGSSYVRFAGVASRTLAALAPNGWWIDALGVTQTTPRLPSIIVSDFVPTKRHGASGRVEIATEDPASWVPNARFVSPLLSANLEPITVSAVRHVWHSNGRARVEVVTSP